MATYVIGDVHGCFEILAGQEKEPDSFGGGILIGSLPRSAPGLLARAHLFQPDHVRKAWDRLMEQGARQAKPGECSVSVVRSKV